ncbi:hypothetical protein HNR29_006798 [Rhizobium leguminosarum]|nr:hypothetical protein [Rhizobium leguminosarum]
MCSVSMLGNLNGLIPDARYRTEDTTLGPTCPVCYKARIFNYFDSSSDDYGSNPVKARTSHTR